MNQLNDYDVEDLRVGMCASFSETIDEADLVLFADVSGDNNAMHVNEEVAAATPFSGRISHGMLTASMISAAIANKMPGPGTTIGGFMAVGSPRPCSARMDSVRRCERFRAFLRQRKLGKSHRSSTNTERAGRGAPRCR